MSYIEREAFIKRLENEADRSSDIINLLILNGIANIVRDENIAPAADVVEVVRCKDCKYFDQYSYLYSDDPSGFGKCEKIHMDIDLTIDDFCSYGERKCEDG